MRRSDDRWNLNIHYHRVLIEAVPSDGRTALDVGCGDGILSFDLADRGLTVTGIDPHEASIQRARSDSRATPRTTFVVGDVFLHPFEPASFDLVASNAMLHHVDTRHGLRRMKDLVRPGGVVAVVGFAQPDGLADRALMLAGAAVKQAQRFRRRYWEHNAPISWPPPLTTSQMRDVVADELPGATFRRLMSNRFPSSGRRRTFIDGEHRCVGHARAISLGVAYVSCRPHHTARTDNPDQAPHTAGSAPVVKRPCSQRAR